MLGLVIVDRFCDVVPIRYIETLVEAIIDSQRVVVIGVGRFFDKIPKWEKVEHLYYNCGKNLATKHGGMYSCGVLYNRELVLQINLWFDTALNNFGRHCLKWNY